MVPIMQDSTSNTAIPPDAPLRGNVFAAACPTRQLLDRIADKWTVLILFTLNGGAQRFGALKRRIGGISQKMLSQTLKSLERDGLVARAVEHTVPTAVTYSITPLGQSLTGSLHTMIDWAETRMVEVASARNAFDARTNTAR
jgi:DNA-binding HxlR family transcriptional regulator